MKKFLNTPIFFERNRVFRVYTGGLPYKEFFNDENGYDTNEDGFFPEEWIASSVKALNKQTFGERDGVSVIKGTNLFFDDLLKEYPEELLGGKKFDCLVKILDSAIRLPFQVHPTKEFSQKYLNSSYGKTEAWLVLCTRPNAKIYFGFKDKVTKEQISELEIKSQTDKHIFDDILYCVEPKVGDVYLIKAGLAHAIGYGCTILEVQEPTDFTIQPERWCGDYNLDSFEEFLGLDKDIALDAIDFNLYGKKAQESAFITPKTIFQTNDYKLETLIGYDDTPCFSVNRHTLSDGEFIMKDAPAVYICIQGKGEITGEGYTKSFQRGSYFFLPHSANGKFKVSAKECILIECQPSKKS